MPVPFTPLLLVALPMADIEPPVEGPPDAAAEAAPLPEAEAPPVDWEAVCELVFALAGPDCEAAALAAASAPVLAVPPPTLAAVAAVPTAAAADCPDWAAAPEPIPELMPMALPAPVLVALEDELDETPAVDVPAGAALVLAGAEPELAGAELELAGAELEELAGAELELAGAELVLAGAALIPTEAVFVDVAWLLAVPTPPTLAIPPAELLDDAPPDASAPPPVPAAYAFARCTLGWTSWTVTGTPAPAIAMALTVASNIIRGRGNCIISFLCFSSSSRRLAFRLAVRMAPGFALRSGSGTGAARTHCLRYRARLRSNGKNERLPEALPCPRANAHNAEKREFILVPPHGFFDSRDS